MSALSPAEFTALMAPLRAEPPLAVAVSGGADSMALALLATEWAAGRILALTVDHGLRAGSGEEAAAVGRWLAARGIPHRILRWTGPKPATGVQAAARAARHALLAEACRAAGIRDLLLAHHAQDQLETVLMRLGRGSGPTGLRGMAAERDAGGIRLLRPLLDVDPARLRAVLRAAGQDWIEDPSNADRRYQRVRLRALLPALAEAGVSAAGVATAARHVAAAEAALDEAVAELVRRAVRFEPGGFALADADALAAAHPEIRRRAIEGLARIVGGGREHLDRAGAQRLAETAGASLAAGRTFAGCRFAPWRGRLLVCREWRRIGDALPLAPAGAAPGACCWDGRFAIEAEGDTAGLLVRPAGEAAPARGAAAKGAPSLPAAARAALPALWRDGALLAIPHLGYRAVRPDAAPRTTVTMAFRPRRMPAGFDSVLASARPCVISF